MEFQHFRWQICLILGIVLISSVTEGKKSCVDKYISKGYFDQKSILDDTKFDNFVENEVSFCLCQNIPPRLLNLDRNLTGEGSHRRLSSTILLRSDELSGEFCEAIIIEKLPHGVFADPFELQHLVHRKVFSDADVFGDTNLELPSFRSNRSLVEIYIEISKQTEINIELPLHARYPPLGQDYEKVKFGILDIFVRCSILGNLQEQKCVFIPTGEIADSNAIPVMWEVPCGNKEHAWIVSIVTFTSAIVSASLIVLASYLSFKFNNRQQS